MKAKNRNNKHKQKQINLSAQSSNEETKPENEGSALTHFLRSRTSFKNRGQPERLDQKSKPHAQLKVKDEKEKSYSFIDELTCLMDDEPINARQQPVEYNNKSKDKKNVQNNNKVQKPHYSPVRLPSRIIQSNESPKIKQEFNRYTQRETDKIGNLSRSPKIHLDNYKQKQTEKNNRKLLTEKGRQNIKPEFQIKPANQAQQHCDFEHKFSKKHTKGILFLYKRSTNQLLPVKRPYSQIYQNTSNNIQQNQAKSGSKKHNNKLAQPQNTKEQTSQSNRLYNLNKNSQQWAQDYIESRPTSSLFRQSEMFETLSPPSSLHSKTADFQKNSKGMGVLQQLNKIQSKFRRLMHNQNRFRTDVNYNNPENLENVTEHSQHIQVIYDNNSIRSILLQQSVNNPNLQQDQQTITHQKHLVQQNQQQTQESQPIQSVDIKKQQGFFGAVGQLPSNFEKSQKQREIIVEQPQSLIAGIRELSLGKDEPYLQIQRSQWSAVQDELLLNFREQPKEYRLEMKCMLRYVSIGKIMDRYLQLNSPIHEQSYQILQDMINTLV